MTLHPTRPSAPRAALLLALGGLALAGCGAERPAEVDREKLGPLDEYFEQIYGGFDEDSADAQMMRVEEVTAECMREQGFEYVPVDWSAGSMGGGSDPLEDLDVEWGTVEFAEEYGYGLTTDPWGASEEVPEEPADEEMWVDPNEDYVMTMSEGEREAYYLALYGDQASPVEGEEDEWEYDWTQAGCQGRAQHEVYETVPGVDEDTMADLQKEMETMWEATEADPRVAEVVASWSECMADAGYPGLAAVYDAEQAFSDRVNAVYEDAWSGDVGEDWTEEDYLAQEQKVQEQIAALTAEEVETAVADYGCREKVRYDAVYQEVSFDHQQTFVDSHRAELDAWVEAAATTDS